MDAFKLDKIAGATGVVTKNPMLTRIYGVAFDTKEELEAYEKLQVEARARDHRKLGKEQICLLFLRSSGLGSYPETKRYDHKTRD